LQCLDPEPDEKKRLQLWASTELQKYKEILNVQQNLMESSAQVDMSRVKDLSAAIEGANKALSIPIGRSDSSQRLKQPAHKDAPQ